MCLCVYTEFLLFTDCFSFFSLYSFLFSPFSYVFYSPPLLLLPLNHFFGMEKERASTLYVYWKESSSGRQQQQPATESQDAK
jgi:hypothetical protein